MVVESPDSPGATGADVLTVSYGGALAPGDMPGGGAHPDVAVNGPLGAQFLAWEYATAVAGVVLGIDPFNQPNVTESKENTNRILASGLPAETPSFTEGAIEVYAPQGAPGDLAGVLRWLLDGLGDDGYLAVMAYLDRFADADAAELRPLLAAGRRPAGHLRLGAAVPALDRPVPQGRPAGGQLPPGDRRGRRGPGGAGQAVHLR